jgi:hypothetical protein
VYESETYLECYQQYMTLKEPWHSESARAKQWHSEALRVWAELISNAGAIRTEPLYSDARAVAEVMMQRARHNIALLVERLPQIGYRFNPLGEAVWQQPDPALTRVLDQIEETYGPLPLTVRMWFDIVGSVTLMGLHPRLSDDADLRKADLNIYAAFGLDRWDSDTVALSWPPGDPLVVWSTFFMAGDGELFFATPRGYTFEIGPDPIHKHGYSGDAPLYFLVPNPSFDATIIDYAHHWTGTFFIPYLQTCFEWGGFPGLRHYPAAAERAREELAFLKEGLLPLI